MKIMLIAAADSIHSVRWANAFVDKGNEVFMIALRNHKERGDKLDARVKQIYLKIEGTKGYFLNALELNKIWREIKPDIVNVHYASGYGLLARLARIHPYVLSVWGSDVYEAPNRNVIMNKIIVKNITSADALASTSFVMADRVRSLINNYDKKISITPFGVDIERFSPVGERQINESDIFWFGTVKKLTYLYGIDTIIKAFYLFKNRWIENGEEGLRPKLFICGKGDNKEDFIKLRDELGLSDDIEIHGYIKNEKIPSLLRSFDVFCLGSNQESFGVSAIEAMACGVPIVTTNADGFVEVIEDGVTGLIVPIGDEKIMANRMWDLYCDEVKRNKMGLKGRERVLRLYNWNENINCLLNVLEETRRK